MLIHRPSEQTLNNYLVWLKCTSYTIMFKLFWMSLFHLKWLFSNYFEKFTKPCKWVFPLKVVKNTPFSSLIFFFDTISRYIAYIAQSQLFLEGALGKGNEYDVYLWMQVPPQALVLSHYPIIPITSKSIAPTLRVTVVKFGNYYKQGRSQTFKNEGAVRGGLGEGADQDSKWRLSIDPCLKCHLKEAGLLTEGSNLLPIWLCPWLQIIYLDIP